MYIFGHRWPAPNPEDAVLWCRGCTSGLSMVTPSSAAARQVETDLELGLCAGAVPPAEDTAAWLAGMRRCAAEETHRPPYLMDGMPAAAWAELGLAEITRVMSEGRLSHGARLRAICALSLLPEQRVQATRPRTRTP